MPPDTLPETFHHYQILRKADGSLWELGRGAMGVTYKAEDTNLRTTVALKVVNSLFLNNQSARERFIREARAAASLRHRNVAAVHHLGNDEQSFFYAMEFIDGATVESVVVQYGPQPWPLALRYMLQVTRALMAAHDKHLVHRDIKPANLMLVAEAGEDDLVVKVIDFGLAKSLVEVGGSMVNVSGSGFVGTPFFASPEQCEEIAPDIRSDIYSLGVVLWYVLTGKPLFTGTLGRVFAQHISAEPSWERLPADLPESVLALLARMLAKDRADRQQTPAELRREIDGCLRPASEADTAAPPVLQPGLLPAAPFAAPFDTADTAATLIEPVPEFFDVILVEPSPATRATALVEPSPEPPATSELPTADSIPAATMAGFPERPVPAASASPVLPPLVPAPSPAHPPAIEPPLFHARPFAVAGNDVEAAGTVPSPPLKTARMKDEDTSRIFLWVTLALVGSVIGVAICLMAIYGEKRENPAKARTESATETHVPSTPASQTPASISQPLFTTISAPSQEARANKAKQWLEHAQLEYLALRKESRGENLITFAVAQARAGDIAGSQQSFAEALKITAAISDNNSREHDLLPIVTAQAKAGDIAGAQQTAKGILTYYYKTGALRDIATAQFKAGDVTGARQSLAQAVQIDRSVDNNSKEVGLWNDALLQAGIGDVAGAQQTSRNFKNEAFNVSTLKAIAVAQFKAGDIAGSQQTIFQALQKARSIKDNSTRAEALQKVAAAQARTGDVAGAKQTAQTIKDEIPNLVAFQAIAIAQAEDGDIAGAQQTVQGMKEHVLTGEALRAIAVAQAKAGNMASSQQTFSRAALMTQKFFDNLGKNYRLRLIAAAQARTGDMTGATLTAYCIDEYFARNEALRAIAAAQVRAGDFAAAEQIVSRFDSSDNTNGAKFKGYIAIASALFVDLPDDEN